MRTLSVAGPSLAQCGRGDRAVPRRGECQRRIGERVPRRREAPGRIDERVPRRGEGQRRIDERVPRRGEGQRRIDERRATLSAVGATLPLPPLPLFAMTAIEPFLPVVLIIAMAVGFAVVNVVASMLLGPRVESAVKGLAYESGMDAIGTTRKRFNVRFYIMAVTFLVFDVEIVFLYPWAVTFSQLEPRSPEAVLFFGRIAFFVGTSVIAYVYAWRKGVFRWD